MEELRARHELSRPYSFQRTNRADVFAEPTGPPPLLTVPEVPRLSGPLVPDHPPVAQPSGRSSTACGERRSRALAMGYPQDYQRNNQRYSTWVIRPTPRRTVGYVNRIQRRPSCDLQTTFGRERGGL